jgi:hypothetical protein
MQDLDARKCKDTETKSNVKKKDNTIDAVAEAADV